MNTASPTPADLRDIEAARENLARLLRAYSWEVHYLDAHIIRSAATPISAKCIIHTPSADGVAVPKYWVFWSITPGVGTPFSAGTLAEAEKDYHRCTLAADINLH